MKLLGSLSLCLLAMSGAMRPGFAATIIPDFDGAFLETTTGPQPVPVFLGAGANPDHVRLRFSVTNPLSISSINSIEVIVPLFNDDDRGNNEAATLKFVVHDLGNANVTLDSFSGG
jgi:hypothetical protein